MALKKGRPKGQQDYVTSIAMLQEQLDVMPDSKIVRVNLTASEELFAQGIAAGKTQKQSAIDAGYSSNSAHVTGARLAGKAKVKARVRQLLMSMVNDLDSARADHLQQLVELRELAKGKAQIAAAIKAEELRGKVLGLYVERQVTAGITAGNSGGVGNLAQVDQANSQELRAAITDAMHRLGIVQDPMTIDAEVTQTEDDPET